MPVSLKREIHSSTYNDDNPVLKAVQLCKVGEKVAVAPHFIQMMGCCIMAVDRYCVVKGAVLKAEKPADPNDHRFEEISEMELFIGSNVLNKFLKACCLQNTYTITVIGASDPNGLFAYVPVLVALWKMLTAFEPKLAEMKPISETIKTIMESCFLPRVAADAIIEAVLTGSKETAVLFSGGFDDVPTYASVFKFDQQYDFILMRTDLSDVQPSSAVGDFFFPEGNMVRQVVRGMDILEDEEKDGYPGMREILKTYSEMRFDSQQSRYDSQFSKELYDENYPFGFEIQLEGMIIVAKKGKFLEKDWMEQLAKDIMRKSNKQFHSFTFDLLHFAGGASAVSIADVQGWLPHKTMRCEVFGENESSEDESGPRGAKRKRFNERLESVESDGDESNDDTVITEATDDIPSILH